MRLYAASSGSVSSVIGSTPSGRGVNGDGPSGSDGAGTGGGATISGCSPCEAPHLQAQHPEPHHAEEHGEERPLQPVADVQQAARGRLGPPPLPRRQQAARDHRAEREQMPHDPARGEHQPEHQTRVRRAVTSDHVPAARGLAGPAAPRHPGDHRPGGAQARRHRDPRRADGHARPLRTAQRVVPPERAAADDAAQPAAGGAQRPCRRALPRGPRVPAGRRAAAGRVGRAGGVPAAALRDRAADDRAGRRAPRPRRARRRRPGRADRDPRARASTWWRTRSG